MMMPWMFTKTAHVCISIGLSQHWAISFTALQGYQLSVHSVLLEWRYIHDFIQLALDPWKTNHKFVASDVHVNFLKSISIPALEPLTKSIEIPERSVPVLTLCGMLCWNGFTKSASSITKTKAIHLLFHMTQLAVHQSYPLVASKHLVIPVMLQWRNTMHYIILQADGSLHGMDKMFSIYADLADAWNELLSDTQGYNGSSSINRCDSCITVAQKQGIIISS
jgi:hypothetical protein